MSWSKYWILNEHGEPERADLMTWARWFETSDRSRVIAQDKDERKQGDVTVSTVFLGLDHNFADEGPPILWETMILGGPLDGYQRRYSSRAAALEGHAKACELQRKADRKITNEYHDAAVESGAASVQ